MMNKTFLALFAAFASVALLANTAQAGGNYGHGHDGQHMQEQNQQQQQGGVFDRYRSRMGMTSSMSIAEIAMAKPQFSTFVTALKAAGLADVFQNPGNYTVFAPTNTAFEMLPEGQLQELLKPENKAKLQQVLKYHVLPKEATANEIPTKRMSINTLEGSDLSIMKSPTGNVSVDEAVVVKADIKANNGVIHAIDRVIMPRD